MVTTSKIQCHQSYGKQDVFVKINTRTTLKVKKNYQIYDIEYIYIYIYIITAITNITGSHQG